VPRLTTLAWVLGLALAAPVHGADAPKTYRVPFELLKSRHIAVQVKINGKGPYRVIFDTGAPLSLINTKVARTTGMVAKNAQPPLFALFGSMGPAKMKTLEVGDLKIANTTAVVMDHPTVEIISKALGPIEGIIGFPVFSRYRMTLDYQTKQMTFTPNGYHGTDALMAMMTNIMAAADDRAVQTLRPAAQWGLVLHKDKKDKDAGVTVREVLPGSAAADAGLRAGDRLLTLDGRWTDSLADAYRAAGYVKPGQRAVLRVRRSGKELDVTVKPRAGL
jgi:hypothetical protein